MSSALKPPQPQLVETPEEIEYELRATDASIWTGTWLLIGIVGFAFASLAFAYFYLRSFNSSQLWRPKDVTAPILLGSAIFGFTLGGVGFMAIGNARRRKGLQVDWQVAGWCVVVFGLTAMALQVWQLSRLGFYPGSSGYASCFIGWAAMNIALLLGATYWAETLMARALRLRRALREEGVEPGSLPVTRIYNSGAEGCTLFWWFSAFVGTLFWVLFYLI